MSSSDGLSIDDGSSDTDVVTQLRSENTKLVALVKKLGKEKAVMKEEFARKLREVMSESGSPQKQTPLAPSAQAEYESRIRLLSFHVRTLEDKLVQHDKESAAAVDAAAAKYKALLGKRQRAWEREMGRILASIAHTVGVAVPDHIENTLVDDSMSVASVRSNDTEAREHQIRREMRADYADELKQKLKEQNDAQSRRLATARAEIQRLEARLAAALEGEGVNEGLSGGSGGGGGGELAQENERLRKEVARLRDELDAADREEDDYYIVKNTSKAASAPGGYESSSSSGHERERATRRTNTSASSEQPVRLTLKKGDSQIFVRAGDEFDDDEGSEDVPGVDGVVGYGKSSERMGMLHAGSSDEDADDAYERVRSSSRTNIPAMEKRARVGVGNPSDDEREDDDDSDVPGSAQPSTTHHLRPRRQPQQTSILEATADLSRDEIVDMLESRDSRAASLAEQLNAVHRERKELEGRQGAMLKAYEAKAKALTQAQTELANKNSLLSGGVVFVVAVALLFAFVLRFFPSAVCPVPMGGGGVESVVESVVVGVEGVEGVTV